MPGIITSIAAIISAAASIFQAVGAFGGGGGSQQQALPAPSAPAPVEGPKGPPPDQTSFDVSGLNPRAPVGVQLSSSMTPLQARTSLSTRAMAGDESIYRSPDALRYYRDLAMQSAIDPATGSVRSGFSFQPSELQLVEQIMGETIRDPTNPASAISAMLRYG